MVPASGYIYSVEYDVRIGKKVLKTLRKMPRDARVRFGQLAEDLRQSGPIRADWPNYSKLSEAEYHCHLSYRWVACWRHHKGTIVIEVYYAGSREDAPY